MLPVFRYCFEDLSLFNNADRLKTVFKPEGLIPGEAGSAILVEKTVVAENRNADIGALIDRNLH